MFLIIERISTKRVFIIHLSKLLLQSLQSVGYGIFGNGKNELDEDHLKIQATSFQQKLSVCLYPILLNILRFRAKTMHQIKRKRQGVPNWHPLKRNRVKITSQCGFRSTIRFQNFSNIHFASYAVTSILKFLFFSSKQF